MSLSPLEIAEIARLLDASHFGELKLELGDFTLRLRGRGSGSRRTSVQAEDANAPSARLEHAAAQDDEVDVPAPFLGIFYHAPGPGHAAFVQPGQQVSEESVIGIIEVMKLMNVVRAGVSGTVVATLAPNAENVEEGQPLIRVKVAG